MTATWYIFFTSQVQALQCCRYTITDPHIIKQMKCCRIVNGWNILKFVTNFPPAPKILVISISILIITGNTLVLLATWRDRSLRQPNKYFVACLAVADLLVGIFIGPAIVYELSVDYKSLRDISIHFCRFMVWIDNLAITASVFTLTFISFDRYLKFSKPLQYKSRMTTSKSFKIIFIIWLISTALATYSATPDSGAYGILMNISHCRTDNKAPSKRAAWNISLFVIFFLLLTVMLIMYARIFIVAHKRQKMLRNGELG